MSDLSGRASKLKPFAAGAIALAAIFGIISGAFLALAGNALTDFAGVSGVFTAYFWRVVRFTLWQAALSTLLSVLPAIFLTLALARRTRFPGRDMLLKLLAIPLALPALVAVLGIVGIWGRSGWLNAALMSYGIDYKVNIYGLSGILLAHVFFNLPLATRLLLVHFERVPAETWRLATQLNLPSRTMFRLIEWPVIRSALPGIATLIFMLCIASFTVILTLGGGPRATTLEVAIYQSLRFDFDPASAVLLALTQIALCTGLVLLAGRWATDFHSAPGLGRTIVRPDLGHPVLRAWDAGIITVSGIFVALPLISIIATGVTADLTRLLTQPVVWRAIGTSAGLALAAGLLSVAAAWSLGSAARSQLSNHHLAAFFGTASGTAGNLILVAPPIVLGAGWFLLLRTIADPATLAPVVVIAINALMAMPFSLRILAPALLQAGRDHDRLCANLGIAGWARFRLIDLPVLLRPAGLALAFSAALSIGDLGAIALFGSEKFITLPFLLYQRFGSYRIDDAAGLALILTVFCLGLIAIAEYLSKTKSGIFRQ